MREAYELAVGSSKNVDLPERVHDERSNIRDRDRDNLLRLGKRPVLKVLSTRSVCQVLSY